MLRRGLERKDASGAQSERGSQRIIRRPARVVAEAMHVCGHCAELHGPFIDALDDRVERTQRCQCRAATTTARTPWPGYDFNTAVEICYSCAAEVVHSGSVWSFFFCEPCLGFARELNDTFGSAVIPTGRASEGDAMGMLGAANRLRAWRNDQVLTRVRSMPTGELTVPRYLDLARGVDKRALFETMSAGFRARRDRSSKP